MKNKPPKSDLRVQYFGQSGYTVTCLQAIDAILNSGTLPERATIVSTSPPTQPDQQTHAFIFWNWHFVPVVIIPGGFASGYPGEGPKGFSLAICMVREKNIPIDGIFLDESDFTMIDTQRIAEIDSPLLQQIKAQSEKMTWPWPTWVSKNDEEFLATGQIWRKFYWRDQKSDFVGYQIVDLDSLDIKLGKKLRSALTLTKSAKTEEWQSIGLLVRDAWIEFCSAIVKQESLDIAGISPNDVKTIVSKFKIGDELEKLAKTLFDLSLNIQHDRKVGYNVAQTCLISTIFTMYTILHRTLDKALEIGEYSKQG
jgi:hypothetical protein